MAVDTFTFCVDTGVINFSFPLQLQSPDFLKTSRLQIFLKQLHAAKKTGMTGKKLYQEIIEPSLSENKEIPSSIKSMIW